MADHLEVEVSSCWNCPLSQRDGIEIVCDHPAEESLRVKEHRRARKIPDAEADSTPRWCPLRVRKSLTVVLRLPESKALAVPDPNHPGRVFLRMRKP